MDTYKLLEQVKMENFPSRKPKSKAEEASL